MSIKKSTRKITALGIACFFVLMSLSRIASAGEREDFKPRLSIKLTGGLRYMRVGDINTHIKSFDDFLSRAIPTYRGGKMKVINNYGSDFEGELRLDIGSKFAVGLGVGFISSESNSNFRTAGIYPFPEIWIYYIPDHLIEFVTELKTKTIPLKIGGYYNLPLGTKINVILNGGFGYYFSKCSLYKYNLNVPLDPSYLFAEISNEYNVSGKNLGIHGGFGFEYKLTNSLALVAEAQRRYAKIKKLEGDRIYYYYKLAGLFGDLDQGKEEGILYIGERDMTDVGYGSQCPDLIISPTKPTGPEFRNIKQAGLDFSGISLRVGIRVKLF